MKFSIIVPVYNAERFVSETIENLLKQDVKKEILLINDGSTDNSLNIIKKYESNHNCIKVIDKPNGGVSSARNLGLNSATGDYVIFVDSDDFIDETLLKQCESLLGNYKIDTIYYTYKYVYPNTDKEDIPFYYINSGLYSTGEWLEEFKKLCESHIIHCIGTNIYKKSIIDKHNIRFKEELTYYEDVCFATEYLGHTHRMFFLNEPLYHYRIINPNSLIAKYNPEASYGIEYMHKEQMLMFERVYGKENIPFDVIYEVWGKDIVGSIDCLYNASNIKETQKDKILFFIKELDYISRSLLVTHSKRNRAVLKIISNYSIEESKIRLASLYRRERIKNEFIITPLRKIIKYIRNK